MNLRFFRRLKFLRHRATLDRELAEELEFHRAMKEQENAAQGLSPTEARQAAQRQMGNLTQAKESSRDHWSFPLVEQFIQDVSIAFRSLRRNRGFPTVAILSLALGIGANTAIFTALDAVLLRPLPYPQPQQLFEITQPMQGLGMGGQIMDPEWEAWRNENTVFTQLTAWSSTEMDYTGNGAPERLTVANVPANFLPTLRISPTLGRNFSKTEDSPNGPRAAILTSSFWHEHFPQGASVLGKNIQLNSEAYTVIGVLPASFQFPGNIQSAMLIAAQLPSTPIWGSPILRGFNVLGRLRDGISPERAKADLRIITQRQESYMPAYVQQIHRHFLPLQITPLRTYLAGDTRWTLLLLLTAVVLLLGIACANVANLQLSRAATRQSEFALRVALGASRSRLILFLLTESLLVAFSGGMCGILLAWILVHSFNKAILLHVLGPALAMNWSVLVFTLLISLCAGLLCGLLPAVVASKPVLYEAMKGGANRLFSLDSRSRSGFVVGQMALTFVLLAGALLLLRSLERVLSVNPGFQPENVFTLQTHFPDARNRTPGEMANMVQTELEHIAALPGVRSVGASSSLLLTSYHMASAIRLEGQPPAPHGQSPSAPTIVISPDYFRTTGIPLLAGRAFTRMDSSHSSRIAVVNASFAHQFFGSANPVGKRIQFGPPSDRWTTIVGVVADAHHNGPEAPAGPELYIPYTQNHDFIYSPIGIAIRSTLPPSALLPFVRKQIAQVDPAQPIFDIATMEHRLEESTGPRRIQTALISSFALIALCLAAIGVYGVLSYAVSQSTREIGIRMALGARKETVLRSVIRRGAVLAIIGIAMGTAVSLATTRYLASFLFHVKPLDWISFAAASLLIFVLAIFASYVPARRAAAVEPMTALRYE